MIIIDNFVKDEVLLKAMKEDKRFWENGYRWWDGWWQSESVDLRHKLIEYIYKDNCPFPIEIEQGGIGHGEGFEHWAGILSKDNIVTNGSAITKGDALNHHFDKDEDYWRETGIVRGPMLGTVYYPPMDEPQCEGGHLKIYNTKELDLTASYELIAPVPNRLVIFDAGKLHAVTEIKKGNRYAIAINIWSHKPSTEMEI
jgi:hypothetical protein